MAATLTDRQREQRALRAAERRAAEQAHADARERGALAAERMKISPVDSARLALSVGLAEDRARKRAARVLVEHQAERRILRETARQLVADRAGMPMLARVAARPNLDALIAKRRDEYRAALAYPMLPAEVLQAAMQAVEYVRLPNDAERDETVSELVRVVLRRHGPRPLRCDVGADWLGQLAKRIYLRSVQTREHKTGMRAAAEQLAGWRSDDMRSAMDAGDSHPDRVYWRAMGMPAPPADADARPETAVQLAARMRERLQLTAKQAGALAVALQSRQRTTLAQSSAEKFNASAARTSLRKRYPTLDALLIALHGPRVAAELALSGAQLIAARTAERAERGSHLPARTLRPASALTLRRFTRPASTVAPPVPVEGPSRFPGYGDGYGGACSALYLYRPGGKHRPTIS